MAFLINYFYFEKIVDSQKHHTENLCMTYTFLIIQISDK